MLRQLRPLRLESEDRGKAVDNGTATVDEVALDAAAIDERAGLATDRLPAIYLDAWARLNCQKPARVPESEWRLALDDGGRFLDTRGEEAAAAQWTPGELFDVRNGLIWQLRGEHVDVIGAKHVRLSVGRTISRGADEVVCERMENDAELRDD